MKIKILLVSVVLILLFIVSCSAETSITMNTKTETVTADDGMVVLTVDVTYPNILDYEKKADEFIRNNIETYTAEALEDQYIPYEFIMRCEVTYNENNKVSVLSEYYVYLGGVHGTTYFESETVNIKTGAKLTPADLIKRDFDVKQMYIDLINNNPDDFFGEESINMLNALPEINFFVTETGLTFYVNPYDIAPYSTGVVTVEVPFD